jgi:hypothetical protein
MSLSDLYCPSGARLQQLRSADPPPVNAIDHLEVLPSKRVLAVYCLRNVTDLDLRHVQIVGGVRVRARVIGAGPASDLPSGALEQRDADALPATGTDRILVVRTDTSGDHSTYTLRLVASADPSASAPGFDPLLSSIRFSFKVDCPSDFDCKRDDDCDDPVAAAPHIDYLAKDYSSFRRLMLDRLDQTMPGWRERNPVDVGIALVEAVAYEADQLSYYQDAVATEAYLGTARLRPSVRRHARLVDYRMHDGSAARAWISIEVAPDMSDVLLPVGTRVLPRDVDVRTSTDPADNGPLEEAAAAGAVVFETLHEIRASAARNAIPLHTWGDPRCCLPAGATSATLLGGAADLGLRRGDVLVIERVDAEGRPISADPQRHAVRLARDGEPQTDEFLGVEVTRISWEPEDAVPTSVTLEQHPDGKPAAVARANVVLAEHGLSVTETGLQSPVRRRFQPFLARRELTHAPPFDERGASGAGADRVEPARQATYPRPAAALPAIELRSEGQVWGVERELLRAGPFAQRFVVEMQEDGRARLRFGDGLSGRRPGSGQTFDAHYRVGNGPAGNVGPDALTQLYPAAGQTAGVPAEILAVRNPLPAVGGLEPEPIEQARLDAPAAFRRQERAVTAADYVAAAERHPEVQRAAATRRWTGSWYTMYVTVDRVGGAEVDERFARDLTRHLDRVRLAGYDVQVDGPQHVALDVSLEVCAAQGFVRTDVEQAVRAVLSARHLSGNRTALFHPDRLSFGQPVYLSAIIAAAMKVDGVEHVAPLQFQRWREPDRGELTAGVLRLGRLEIARLDDDPSVPEFGRLELTMKGGS